MLLRPQEAAGAVNDDQCARAVEQLVEALCARAADWGAVLGSDVQALLSERSEAAAQRLALQLYTPGERESTATDLMQLLNDPGEDDPSWWTTPLGELTANALDSPPGVTHDQAAALLGVTRGTIAQWVSRETLGRLPNGRINIQSVLARRARKRPSPPR